MAGKRAKAATETPAVRGIWRILGPGLITGASDDDPSGIGSFSQIGAQFGFSLSWVLLFSFPLMAAIQEISARIGRVSGRGIAGNIRRFYSPALLFPVVALLVIANVINIGADLGAMGDALALLIGGPRFLYIAGFGALCVALEIFVQYGHYVAYLKWTTIALLAYVATAFVVHMPWGEVFHATFIPSLQFDTPYIVAIVAALGTTISPYLLFWQSSQEAEDERVDPHAHPLRHAPEQAVAELRRIRLDTCVGMFISNLISWFILITVAATLHAHGVTNVDSSAQAAQALLPIAGPLAYGLFALGIIGTGMLAVPVLAGSAAYALGEAMGWQVGLAQKARRAPAFYGAIAFATVIGAAMNFSPIDPIKALFWSAVLNGVVAVPMMVITMIMARSPRVMGPFVLSLPLTLMGWLATLVMAVVVAGLFATWGQQ